MQHIDAMSEREMDIALAKALGYSVYHYDKDVAANCYYMLMDSEFDPVVSWSFRAGERKTEQEAWNDAPAYTTNLAATYNMEEELQRRNLTHHYIVELAHECGFDVSENTYGNLWKLAHATPMQRVKAALRVVMKDE